MTRSSPGKIKKYLAILLSLLFCVSSVVAQVKTPIPLASTFSMHSQVLGEDRTIVVALPAGYVSSNASYPVLYLLDGDQNIWHVAGSVEILTRTGAMPPVIIVGVKSENRMRDFTPSSVEGVPYSGGGKNFLNFISAELIPYIESNYRTHPYRLLEGHSLAGLFAVNTFLENTQLFDAYIVMSPAMWWNNEEMTEKAKSFFKNDAELNRSIYFGIGADDGQGMQNELGRFVETIQQDAPKGLSWSHKVFENEGHMSAPLLANYYGLKFVFSTLKLPDALWQEFDSEKFLAHERMIMETYGEFAKQSEGDYVTLGLKLVEEGNYEGAITVFKRNTEAYPIYPANFAWLADAYEKHADYDKAIEAYSLALTKSKAINFGQEKNYMHNIERLSKLTQTE
ncbi:alpha/beta hydrolase-fold protein [Pseudohongiella sp.]|uniref:Uncharacterized protein n=1 Tax=marine sediment metagenome TaxID=412755 RepID=A0A0F9XIN1_9ZZZZ|nr:alpha/beta hydrolase-fold protein [Pseudohongiella sp.]HDZ08956.1 alpha/beta hydrolase [Pseudohongiella sp.]